MRWSEGGKKTLNIMASAYTSYNSYISCPSPKLELLSKMPLVISVWLYWLLLEELCNNQKGIHWEGGANIGNCVVLYSTVFSLLCCIVMSFLELFVLHFVVVCSGRSRPWAKGGGGGARFSSFCNSLFFTQNKGGPPSSSPRSTTVVFYSITMFSWLVL